MKVEVYSSHDDRYKEEYRFRGTYAHGELEDDLDYDIFSFDRSIEIDSPGEYKFIINNRNSTFFVWLGDEVNDTKWRGLLVYDTDEDFAWALDKYRRAEQIL
tara:strand:+ start:435 stop:740 length:306 start_codon:yes stop_codon:yes gene_type:complete